MQAFTVTGFFAAQHNTKLHGTITGVIYTIVGSALLREYPCCTSTQYIPQKEVPYPTSNGGQQYGCASGSCPIIPLHILSYSSLTNK